MSTPAFKTLFLVIAAVWLLQVLLTIEAYAQKFDLKQLKPLHYRHIGPVGNRIIGVVGIPVDPLAYYVCAASGGIWKTEDGGINRKPIFDEQPVHSIGAIIAAPSDSQIVWAGTGEEQLCENNAGGPFIINDTTRPNQKQS